MPTIQWSLKPRACTKQALPITGFLDSESLILPLSQDLMSLLCQSSVPVAGEYKLAYIISMALKANTLDRRPVSRNIAGLGHLFRPPI